MKTDKFLIILLIFLCFCAGYFCKWFFDRNTQNPIVIKEIEIEYLPSDTVRVETKIPVPYKVEVEKEIPAMIDTVKVVADYFKKRSYHQVLVNDSTGYIEIIQDISMNQIENQKLVYVPPPTKLITITKTQTIVQKEKLRPFVGTSYLWDNEKSYFQIHGGLQYHHFQLGVGIGTNKLKSVQFNYIF